MRKYLADFFKFLIFCLFISMISFSCIQQKSITYFNNLPDSAYIPLSPITAPQQTIQVNDILQMNIGGENEKTAQYISGYLGGSGSGGATTGGVSAGGGGMQLTVDVNGDIDLPKAGKIKVAGLTRQEAKDTITAAYSQYLQDPIITLTLSPFKFAVLGEVKAPGYYTSATERLNVFEAVALAGDMTQFAKRNTVKIIRQDVTGKREVITLDFTDKSILNSPYYYINRYDIIYVETGKQKLLGDNSGRTTAVIGTISTLIAIIVLIFKG
jgi:polysaccharide biosynthesis/export protein